MSKAETISKGNIQTNGKQKTNDGNVNGFCNITFIITVLIDENKIL